MPKHRKTRKQINQDRIDKQNREALARKVERRIAHALKPRYPESKIKKPDVFVPKQVWHPDEAKVKSRNNGVEPVRVFKAKPKYDHDPELAQREVDAQQEIARKKKRTAPAYSKGGYMYITDGMDPKDLGKKNPT